MEVTILDADDDRYDPEILNVKADSNRLFLVVRHAEPVEFSRGERAQLILASDAHEERDLSDIVKKRRSMATVRGICVRELPEDVYCWEIRNVSAVTEIIDSEDSMSLLDFV